MGKTMACAMQIKVQIKVQSKVQSKVQLKREDCFEVLNKKTHHIGEFFYAGHDSSSNH
jgi:hypothetical protein